MYVYILCHSARSIARFYCVRWHLNVRRRVYGNSGGFLLAAVVIRFIFLHAAVLSSVYATVRFIICPINHEVRRMIYLVITYVYTVMYTHRGVGEGRAIEGDCIGLWTCDLDSEGATWIRFGRNVPLGRRTFSTVTDLITKKRNRI